MTEQMRCSLTLVTQNGCASCEMLKESIPEGDIGLEVINLSTDENAGELLEQYHIEKVPVAICDCGEDDVHFLNDVPAIKSFIEDIVGD